jgi:glutathione S-transferase
VAPAIDTTGDTMQLYHMRGACSLADLIVLGWLGVPHEIVPMTLESIKAPAYLARNPGGNVPLLVHDDLALTENVAILGYLADLHPQAQLAANARRHVRAYLERLDGVLADRDWLTGQRSIADPYLYVVLRWAHAKGVDMAGLDALAAFHDRMSRDPAVRDALRAEET